MIVKLDEDYEDEALRDLQTYAKNALAKRRIAADETAAYAYYQKLVDTGGRVERFQRRVAKGRRQSARATA